MSEYQPGRIYSGVVNGKRVHLICRPNEAVYPWSDGMHCLLNCDVTDVRGPLVVLDLGDAESRVVHEELRRVFRVATDKAADQIEAQTTPPLQVGWHEAIFFKDQDGDPMVRWFTGSEWLDTPGDGANTWNPVDWRSVAYLGKGTRA